MKFLLVLFCATQLTTVDHDVPLAMFKIHQESKTLLLDITFDLEDLAKELDLASIDISKDVVRDYLESHTSFMFDRKINKLDVIELKLTGDHLKVSSIFKTELATIKQIEIVNTCLLNVANHSNIIQLHLAGTTKDYRMHKRRNTITIDL